MFTTDRVGRGDWPSGATPRRRKTFTQLGVLGKGMRTKRSPLQD